MGHLSHWILEARDSFKLPTYMKDRTKTVSHIVSALILMGFVLSIHAQNLSIPDPGLNAAIRDALHKSVGPLTEQDLLSLVSLIASERDIKRTDGLENALNLNFLDLDSNSLTNFSLPSRLTKLQVLDVSFN